MAGHGPGGRDHPRSRGEHGCPHAVLWFIGGSSPLTRGARFGRGPPCRGVRIIPAHAGSTTTHGRSRYRNGDHPRSRGEHSSGNLSAGRGGGSSPLTRGALGCGCGGSRQAGIIPAHAGSTSIWGTAPPSNPDHPRSRGEHRATTLRQCRTAGSSPLTRGARVNVVPRLPRRRIIPAHAGSTSSTVTSPIAAPGSSPLTRGAPWTGLISCRCLRIIPAHAGSTQMLPQSQGQ